MVALSIGLIIPAPAAGLSFTPDKGGPQALKGHQRHVAKGGKQGGALHTGPFLPLFPNRTSLQLSGSSRDPHIHSPLHTHTHSLPSKPRFLQLGVLQPESHAQLGRRVEWWGETSLSPGQCKPTPHPTHTTLRSWRRLCKGHSASASASEARGGGWGGQASGAP